MLLPPLLAVCALTLCALGGPSAPQPHARHKRQEPDDVSEDYVADYAGNNNEGEPKDNFHEDDFGDMNLDGGANDFNEDNNLASPEKGGTKEEEVEEPKPKKKSKKHKYLKKTLEFLKRVLDPNKLMQNAYITEMLRRFSHQEDPDYETKESLEEEIHTTKKPKSRRGRPRKRDKIPPGITGIIKKGVMSITQMELDKRKFQRRVKMIKRLARKAKKPLKTAVKIFLSSRNQGVGGYGGGGYDNNNY